MSQSQMNFDVCTHHDDASYKDSWLTEAAILIQTNDTGKPTEINIIKGASYKIVIMTFTINNDEIEQLRNIFNGLFSHDGTIHYTIDESSQDRYAIISIDHDGYVEKITWFVNKISRDAYYDTLEDEDKEDNIEFGDNCYYVSFKWECCPHSMERAIL